MLVAVFALTLSGLAAEPPAAPEEPMVGEPDDRLEEEFGEPPPPPPPPPEEDSPGDPIGDAPLPPPPEAPTVPPPASPEPAPSELQAVQPGLGTAPTRAIQVGAGLASLGACQTAGLGGGLCAGACCQTACPGAGTLLLPLSCCCASTVGGALAGVAVGTAGDFLGQERAPLLWPTLAGAGTGAVFGLLSGGLWLTAPLLQGTVPGVPDVAVDPRVANNLEVPLGLAGVAAGCLGLVAVPAVAALVYGMTAEPKRPGDEGGFPGLMDSAHPSGERVERPLPVEASPRRTAMAY